MFLKRLVSSFLEFCCRRNFCTQKMQKNWEKLQKATVVLHNFVKFHDGGYCPPDYVDLFQGDEIINGLWRREVSSLRHHGRMTCNNATRNAFALRDHLKDYIMSHPINK